MEADPISFTGFSIFDTRTAQAEIRVDGAVLVSQTMGTPLYYYRAPTADGTGLSLKEPYALFGDFVTIPEGASDAVTLLPSVSQTMYVFEITTDSMDQAGTAEDIQCRLTYVTPGGEEKTMEPFLLRDAVSDFYGYWPGSGGDLAYTAGTSEGGVLIFCVRYPNVDYFKSVELSIDLRTIGSTSIPRRGSPPSSGFPPAATIR